MVKKQQMRWAPHLLLQVRAKVPNDEIAEVFQRSHPVLVVPAESATTVELGA